MSCDSCIIAILGVPLITRKAFHVKRIPRDDVRMRRNVLQQARYRSPVLVAGRQTPLRLVPYTLHLLCREISVLLHVTLFRRQDLPDDADQLPRSSHFCLLCHSLPLQHLPVVPLDDGLLPCGDSPPNGTGECILQNGITVLDSTMIGPVFAGVVYLRNEARVGAQPFLCGEPGDIAYPGLRSHGREDVHPGYSHEQPYVIVRFRHLCEPALESFVVQQVELHLVEVRAQCCCVVCRKLEPGYSLKTFHSERV